MSRVFGGAENPKFLMLDLKLSMRPDHETGLVGGSLSLLRHAAWSVCAISQQLSHTSLNRN